MANPSLRFSRQGLQTRPEQVTTAEEGSIVSDLTLPRNTSPGDDFGGDNDTQDHTEHVNSELEKDHSGGDGGDSDVEGDEVLIHESAVVTGRDDSDDIEPEDFRGKTLGLGIVDLTDSSGTGKGSILMADGNVSMTQLTDTLNQCDVKISTPPVDWTTPVAQENRGEPKFEDVDNPGKWPRYCFRPIFAGRSSTTKYKHHALPTGAMPFPKNAEGNRKTDDGWEFHYDGWKNPGRPHRHGATATNMFPEGTEGSLDATVLKNLGLTKLRMEHADALFFLQLILPICNTKLSGIQNDPRMSYYHEVETHTNCTKFASGMGASYGHTWAPTTSKELVNFDGILVKDGVLGGSQGALHRRWDKGGPCYLPDVARTMLFTRFGELKRSMKLCNNDKAPKKGEGKFKRMST